MRGRSRSALEIALAIVLFVREASAFDPFEIQVYDGTAVPARGMGFELHSNAFVRGLKEANGSELPLDRQLHFTLESFIGLFSWWELGTYLQTAYGPDGNFHLAGTKLRTKFVTPPKKNPKTIWDHFRFGINGELGIIPRTFDRDVWGIELRPIAAYEDRYVSIAVNPIFDFGKTGVSFQPSIMALYKFDQKASIGLEYYANFGVIGEPSPIEKQEHYVFPVMNLLAIPHFEFNFGAGAGLTKGSNPFIVKMILGYVWE